MKVAITGASGFLGRYLARELTNAGHQCRGLTRSEPPDHAIEWVVGSLDDGDALGALVEGAGGVVHAAFDHPGGGFLAPDLDVLTTVERNLVGTVRLIEAARQAQVGRMVVISSGAVHDEILGDRPLDETHPLWPRSPYGATKAAIEAFVHSYGRGARFPICALRPTVIYGAAEPPTASRWFDLIQAVVRGETVRCAKGAKVVHARDVARAVALLLTAEGVAGEVYHCVDQFVSERQVAEIARTVTASAARIEGETPPVRHPITSAKLRDLGMTFGGEPLLTATIAAIVAAIPRLDPAEAASDRV